MNNDSNTATKPNNNRRRGNRHGAPEQPIVKEFEEKIISIDRVARVVKGGRRFRFRALVVVGNGKGKVGIGIAKGGDVTYAVSKAVESAKKNMFEFKIEKENGSIPHDAVAKVGGAHILIKPAPAGTGLIAGGTVRTILETAGIKNVVSKSLGSSSKVNNSYATLECLKQLVPKKSWITAKTVVKETKKATKVAEKTTKSEDK